MSDTPAVIALADGTLFHGTGFAAEGQAKGEVVFNTAMTGYQEILTDPSYCRQIVTLTYPHIGNTGIIDQPGQFLPAKCLPDLFCRSLNLLG